MNQIRAVLIEQGLTVRKSVAALRPSLQAILDTRDDEMSLRMRKLILGLQQDWIWMDKRIDLRCVAAKVTAIRNIGRIERISFSVEGTQKSPYFNSHFR